MIPRYTRPEMAAIWSDHFAYSAYARDVRSCIAANFDFDCVKAERHELRGATSRAIDVVSSHRKSAANLQASLSTTT